jgi:hypothetical protein
LRRTSRKRRNVGPKASFFGLMNHDSDRHFFFQ